MVDVTMPTPAVPDTRADSGPAPWGRWTLALVVFDGLFAFANASAIAGDLAPGGPFGTPSAVELFRVQVTAIGLGLLVSAPLWLLLALLARRTSLPIRALPFAIALGVLAFLAATRIDDAVFLATSARSMAQELGFDPTVIVLAPILEELIKLIALLAFALIVQRRSAFGVREGIIAGALIGLGANAVEAGVHVQIAYTDTGTTMFGTIMAVRFGAFGVGLHVATTALMGAAVGAVLTSTSSRRRPWFLVVAYVTAVALHMLWNIESTRLILAVVENLGPRPDVASDEPFAQSFVWIAATVVGLLVVFPALAVVISSWRGSIPERD